MVELFVDIRSTIYCRIACRQEGRPNLNLLLDVSYEVGVEVLSRLGSTSEDGEESFQLPAGVKVTRCETLPALVQDRSESSYGGGDRSWGAGSGAVDKRYCLQLYKPFSIAFVGGGGGYRGGGTGGYGGRGAAGGYGSGSASAGGGKRWDRDRSFSGGGRGGGSGSGSGSSGSWGAGR